MYRDNPFVPVPGKFLRFRYRVRPFGVPILDAGQEILFSSSMAALGRLFNIFRFDRASSFDMGDRIAYFFFYEEERKEPEYGTYNIEIKCPYQIYVTPQLGEDPFDSKSYATNGFTMMAPSVFEDRLAHETLLVIKDYCYLGHEIDIVPAQAPVKEQRLTHDVIKC